MLVDLDDRKRRARMVRKRFYAEAAERSIAWQRGTVRKTEKQTADEPVPGNVTQTVRGTIVTRSETELGTKITYMRRTIVRNGRTGSPTVEKVAAPCPRRNAGWFKGLASKALSVAKVLASAVVPDAVYEERMAACRECAYSTKALGHHWCGCCGCPKWNADGIGSSLEYKNKKAAWRCSRPDPAFGPWEKENWLNGRAHGNQ